MNPYIKSKHNKSINKKQDGGYDGTESVPIKATFADKMKQQQQYGSPQLQQGNLPANIENRTRGRNLRGDDVVSTIDDDIASKYAVTPQSNTTPSINTNSNINPNNPPRISTDYTKKAGQAGLYASEQLERDANARFDKSNPIKGYEGMTSKSGAVNYNDEIFNRGKNTKNNMGVEETPLYTSRFNRPTTDIGTSTKTSSKIELGGDKKGNENMGSYEGKANSEMHAHMDFKKKGWSDESGNLTDNFYNQLGDKTLADGLKRFGLTAADITSDKKDFGNPAINNLVSNVRGKYAAKRENDTSYYTITKDVSGLTNFKDYLTKNNPTYQSMSEGERAKYFLPENREMLEKQFGVDMNNFTKNRTSAKGSYEVERKPLVTGESTYGDKSMEKDKSSTERTPGYEGYIKTEQGDRYKAEVETPKTKLKTPPSENRTPNNKPNTGKTSPNRTKTTTPNSNPGTGSVKPGNKNSVKYAYKNESEAKNKKLGTETTKDMKVEGKGGDYKREELKRFSRQMGGYTDMVNSDYGQYTQSNTSANPQLGSIDYYKQVMKHGGRVSRFEQLDSEMNKANQDKPKYQAGQKIKYKMGGEIKEGVVKSYDKDNKKLELY